MSCLIFTFPGEKYDGNLNICIKITMESSNRDGKKEKVNQNESCKICFFSLYNMLLPCSPLSVFKYRQGAAYVK